MTETSGWTFETLKTYFDARLEDTKDAAVAAIQEKDKRDQQRFEAQTRAIDAASLVVDRALVEARQGVADQFQGVNTKLDQLGDQVGVPRQEMDALLASAASNRHVEIADAIGAVVKQFVTDFDRLTKTVETQGEQFNKSVTTQSEQWGVEFKTLNTTVAAIQKAQTARASQSMGIALTARTAAGALAALVALIAVFSFLSRYLLK